MLAHEVVGEGPGNKGAGVLVVIKANVSAGEIGYYPDKQIWETIPKSDVLVGMYTDDPPTPEDLQRPTILDGHLVALEDNHQWMIPVARAVAEVDGEVVAYDKLPHNVGTDSEGNWSRNGTLPKFSNLWKLALRWWEAIAGELEGQAIEGRDKVGITMEFNDIAEGAFEALQTNYRVGRREVSMLGLFSDQSMYQILHALVDMPTIQVFAKKKLIAQQPDT